MGDYPVGRAFTGEDHTGAIRDVHVHNRGGHQFGLSLTRPFLEFNAAPLPFLSATLGNKMNTNAAFSGTPEIIHNGGTSTEWTGSALQGTWNFADSGKISLTSGNDQDSATFAEQTPTTIDLTGFTALTGKIDLETYVPASQSISIFFDLAGVQVGDTLTLDNFIDTGNFAEQTFVISLTEFNFASDDVDGFTIVLNRAGGTRPTFKFDDIQLEQTGNPAIFTSRPDRGEIYHVDALRFTIVDADTNIVTVVGDTENATLPGLSYNKILGLSALTNGITFQRTQNNEVNLTAVLKQLSDFVGVGFDIKNPASDGTNTLLTLEVSFQRPFALEGNRGDKMTLTVADNLEGLLVLNAVARGALEV